MELHKYVEYHLYLTTCTLRSARLTLVAPWDSCDLQPKHLEAVNLFVELVGNKLVCLCMYVPVLPNFLDRRDETLFAKSRRFCSLGISYCATFVQHPEVQNLLHSKHRHFDAIIVEALSNECLMGFAHKFKAAIIQVCPFGGTHWMGD